MSLKIDPVVMKGAKMPISLTNSHLQMPLKVNISGNNIFLWRQIYRENLGPFQAVDISRFYHSTNKYCLLRNFSSSTEYGME